MNQSNPSIPSTEEILRAFEQAPEVSTSELAKLAEVNRALDQEPKFLADLQKAMVVSQLRLVLDSSGQTQVSLAQRWGKSRQYISNLFSDKLTNFTLETITFAAVLLGQRATVKIHRPDQEVYVRNRIVRATAQVTAVLQREPVDSQKYQNAAALTPAGGAATCSNLRSSDVSNEYALAA